MLASATLAGFELSMYSPRPYDRVFSWFNNNAFHIEFCAVCTAVSLPMPLRPTNVIAIVWATNFAGGRELERRGPVSSLARVLHQ